MAKIERADTSLITFRLKQAVGGSNVAIIDVVVVELEDSEGATGLGFSYVIGGRGELALRAAAMQIDHFVIHQESLPPVRFGRTLFKASTGRAGVSI